MQEKNLFAQVNFWRQFTLQLLRSTSESVLREVPEGFSNNILWNAGHILVTYDEYFSTSMGQSKQFSDEYHTLFSTGSSPFDWEMEPPPLKDLLSQLEDQTLSIQEACHGRLQEDLLKPLPYEQTVDELLCFLISHECYHLGVMTGISRTLTKV